MIKPGRIRSSLTPSIQTLLKPTVCLPLMRRCTSPFGAYNAANAGGPAKHFNRRLRFLVFGGFITFLHGLGFAHVLALLGLAVPL